MTAHVEGMRSLLTTRSSASNMEESAGQRRRKKSAGAGGGPRPICQPISPTSLPGLFQGVDVYGVTVRLGVSREHYLRTARSRRSTRARTGIQALDLVGRKIGMKKGMHLLGMVEILNTIISSGREFEELKQACQYLDEAGTHDGSDPALLPPGQGCRFPDPDPLCPAVPRALRGCRHRSLLMQQAEIARRS